MVVEMLPHLQGSSEAFLGRSWESCSIKESYSIKFDQRDISDVQESRSERRWSKTSPKIGVVQIPRPCHFLLFMFPSVLPTCCLCPWARSCGKAEPWPFGSKLEASPRFKYHTTSEKGWDVTEEGRWSQLSPAKTKLCGKRAGWQMCAFTVKIEIPALPAH